MGKECLLTDVKEKMRNARELCPGMSSDLYLLTDYLSESANDELVPSGLAIALILAMNDISAGENGFGEELKPELVERNSEVLLQASYFPQVVDIIAEEEFSKEFREIVKDVLKFDPPVRAKVQVSEDIPENVRVAVEWWANAIQAPRYANVSPSVALFAMNNKRGKSEEEINTFKDALTKIILENLEQFNRCDLRVDYNACPLLKRAGDTIGLNDMLDYPFKTSMCINYNVVEVYENGKYTTLWNAKDIDKNLK